MKSMIVRTNVTLGFVLLLCAGGCRNQVGLSVSIPRGVENVQIGTITVSEPGISEHRLSIGPHKMSWTFDGDMFTVDIDNKRGDNYLFIRTQHPWLETDGAVTVLTPFNEQRPSINVAKGRMSDDHKLPMGLNEGPFLSTNLQIFRS